MEMIEISMGVQAIFNDQVGFVACPGAQSQVYAAFHTEDYARFLRLGA